MLDGMENFPLSQGPSGRAFASTSELISAFFRGGGQGGPGSGSMARFMNVTSGAAVCVRTAVLKLF